MHKPDEQLLRKILAESLTDAGYPIAVTTLATKASRGGGPPFRKFGNRVTYRWGDALAWAKARTTPVVHTHGKLPTK